jgi:hypothetical protein
MKSLNSLPRSKFRLGPKHMLSLPSYDQGSHSVLPLTMSPPWLPPQWKNQERQTTRKSKSQITKIETPTLRWLLETPMKHLPPSQPLLVQATSLTWRVPDLGSWILDSGCQPCHSFRAANFSKATTIRSPPDPASFDFQNASSPFLCPPTRPSLRQGYGKIHGSTSKIDFDTCLRGSGAAD